MIKFATHTAHLLSWIPDGHEEVLYVSPATRFPPEKAIRGGVPICWPNFAAAEGMPFHGFARDSEWKLIDQKNGGKTNVRIFELPPNIIFSQWGKKATLNYKVTSSNEFLQMELITINLEASPIIITEALHTYFRVGDINSIEVTGQDGDTHYDKVEDKYLIQKGSISFIKETDRIYQTSNSSTLNDPVLKRKILISKSGASSTVIWNPWIEKAKEMGDLPNQDYQHFCCIEAANTRLNPVTILPGASHTLIQKVEIFKSN